MGESRSDWHLRGFTPFDPNGMRFYCVHVSDRANLTFIKGGTSQEHMPHGDARLAHVTRG
jgi:hypothetical protein